VTRVSQSVRQKVRKRADNRCEYCRLPDEMGRYTHHIDHIIPIAHGGTSELDNLAWACFDCNTNKIRDVASYDPETKVLTPFYNPRTQNWSDHFEMESGIIVGKTPVGRVTVQMLQMNNEMQVEARRELIDSDLW
jgi:HNH endonuclease